MSDDLGRFAEQLEEEDSERWSEALFGDCSLLAGLLTDPRREFAMLAGELQALKNHPSLPRWLNGGSATEAQHVLDGLIHALNAAGPVSQGDFLSSEAIKEIEAAISSFDVAWGSGPLVVHHSRDWGKQDGGIAEAFNHVNTECSQVGYWIAWDLLDRLVKQGKESTPRSVPYRVTTPILGAQAGGGSEGHLHLTVELFVCKQGTFCPDPLALGLTSITVGAADARFLAAMQRMWEASGLQGRFRGRWRITNPPEPQRPARSATRHIPSLQGRSAEAATLSALLAASGDPYGETPSETRPAAEPLDLQVAISAKVEVTPGKPAIDLALAAVAYVPQKLEAAYPVLDTVAFAADQQVAQQPGSEQLRHIDKKRSDAESTASGAQYAGIRIEFPKTVADALDLLLVTNRYLKKYHAHVREDWLKQWERRTARAAGDDAPGPDDENLSSSAAVE